MPHVSIYPKNSLAIFHDHRAPRVTIALRYLWILQKCLSGPLNADTIRDMKKLILKKDWSQSVNNARQHSSLKYIVCSDEVAACWCSVWDRALDLGTKGTRLSQCLFSTLCRPLLVIVSARFVIAGYHFNRITCILTT